MDDSLPLLYSHCAHKCQQYTAILISQWRHYNKSNTISFYQLFPATFKTFKAEARPRFSHDTAGEKTLWRAILCSLHLRLLHMLSAGLNLALGDVTYTQSWTVHPPPTPHSVMPTDVDFNPKAKLLSVCVVETDGSNIVAQMQNTSTQLTRRFARNVFPSWLRWCW